MKQTHIEGTEPSTKGKRTARELANDAAAKARSYRRKALLAENPALNKLVLAINHGLDASDGPLLLEKLGSFVLEDVHARLTDAKVALDEAIDNLVGA